MTRLTPTSETIDAGTNCRNRSRPPGTLGLNASADTKVEPITFADLSRGYPGESPYLDAKASDPPKGFENQCAIKVSVALHAARVDLSTFRGAHVFINHARAAIRAEELAAWLRIQHINGLPPTPRSIAGKDWQEKIKAKTGIVFFGDFLLRPGEKTPSGDHIDLWNGSRLTTSGLEGALVTIARFGLGINAGPGFSGLGNSKTILFWEVK